MGSDYHYRKIDRWETLAGVEVPVDEHGHYLDHDDIRGDEARDLTSPYGALVYAVGFGEEGSDDGDWMTCFDFALLPDGRVILHAAVNSESGGFIQDGGYDVVSKDEAPEAALGLCRQALETVQSDGHEHDEEGWNQDPWYFARAVAKACKVKPYDKMKDEKLRRGSEPSFGGRAKTRKPR
jgi:hypothetical protein